MNAFKNIQYNEKRLQYGETLHMKYQHNLINSLYESKKDDEVILCAHFNPYEISSADILISAYSGQVVSMGITSAKIVIGVEYTEQENTIGNIFHSIQKKDKKIYDYAHPHIHLHIKVKDSEKEKLFLIDSKINPQYSRTKKALLTEDIRMPPNYRRYVSDQLESQLHDKVVIPEIRVWSMVKPKKSLLFFLFHYFKKLCPCRFINTRSIPSIIILLQNGILRLINVPDLDSYFVFHLRFFDDS